MRKLNCYVASSLDGFILREDESLNGFDMGRDQFPDLLSAFPGTIPAHLRGQLGVGGGGNIAAKLLPEIENVIFA